MINICCIAEARDVYHVVLNGFDGLFIIKLIKMTIKQRRETESTTFWAQIKWKKVWCHASRVLHAFQTCVCIITFTNCAESHDAISPDVKWCDYYNQISNALLCHSYKNTFLLFYYESAGIYWTVWWLFDVL